MKKYQYHPKDNKYKVSFHRDQLSELIQDIRAKA